MPSMLTHYLCAKKTYSILNENMNYLLLNKYEKVYSIGTLGPDILFFHNQWPWKKDRALSEIGGIIHSEKINDFFRNMLNFIMESNEKSLLLAYFMGFCCHYALDCVAHPYIFYFSGFDESGNLDTESSNFHRDFETNLDYCICKEIENTIPYDLDAPALFDIPIMEQKLVSDLLSKTINATYNKPIISNTIFESINDFKKIILILKDKTGFKKKLFTLLEKSFKFNIKPSTFIYPIEITDSIDYLNISKNVWFNPWDNSIAYYDTFLDLFEKGINKSLNYFKIILEFNNKKISLNDLLKELGNLSYSSGIDCNEKLVFKYKNPVKDSKKIIPHSRE